MLSVCVLQNLLRGTKFDELSLRPFSIVLVVPNSMELNRNQRDGPRGDGGPWPPLALSPKPRLQPLYPTPTSITDFSKVDVLSSWCKFVNLGLKSTETMGVDLAVSVWRWYLALTDYSKVDIPFVWCQIRQLSPKSGGWIWPCRCGGGTSF